MRKSKASEAHRVAQHVAAIRAALHKHGYQICHALETLIQRAIARSAS